MASVTRSNRQKSKTNALKFGGMRTTDTKPGRSVNPLETERPIGLFSSLKIELSVLITISTAIAFIMAWFLLKVGLSVWIAMPITLAVALGITYFFSRGLTSPLRQMRDAAEAMAEGDYTVRVHVDSNSRDEVGQLALTFNEMAEELQHADQMRRDMVANVSHELRTPVSALQAMVENMADGVIDPTPSNLESILNQTHRLSDLIAFLLDLSRMEAGAASLQIEMFNFADFLTKPWNLWKSPMPGMRMTSKCMCPTISRWQAIRTACANCSPISSRTRSSIPRTIPRCLSKHTKTRISAPSSPMSSISDRRFRKRRVPTFSAVSSKEKTGPGTESGGTGLGLSIARWAAQLHVVR